MNERLPVIFDVDGTLCDTCAVAKRRSSRRPVSCWARLPDHHGWSQCAQVTDAGVLEWPCIGVGSGERAAALEREGAAAVFADFSDVPSFIQALESCADERRRLR